MILGKEESTLFWDMFIWIFSNLSKVDSISQQLQCTTFVLAYIYLHY